MKKFFAKLVTNFQPRMNLRKQRSLEGNAVAKEESDHSKFVAREREHGLRDEMKKREEPSDAVILGPSDSKEKI